MINARSGPAHLLRDFHDARSDMPMEVSCCWTRGQRSTPSDRHESARPSERLRVPGGRFPGASNGHRFLTRRCSCSSARAAARPAATASPRRARPTPHLDAEPRRGHRVDGLVRRAEPDARSQDRHLGTQFRFRGDAQDDRGIVGLATFIGAHARPSALSTVDGLKSIPLRDPIPVYPTRFSGTLTISTRPGHAPSASRRQGPPGCRGRGLVAYQ